MGGKGGGGGYTSPYINQYEKEVYGGIQNRLGANGTSGAGAYNYSGTNAPAGKGGSSTSNAPNTTNYGSSYSPYSGGSTFTGGTLRQTATPSNPNTAKISGYDDTRTQLINSALNPRGAYTPPAPTNTGATPDQIGKAGSPLGGPLGLQVATAGYDFSPVNQAINQLGQGPTTYNPFQFNFGSLPAEYTSKAYQAGASDINRAGANQLAQLQEATGTRRPGLLFQEAQQSQRDTAKNLAGLRTQLGLNEVNQNLALQQAQQQAQAGQNLSASQENNQNKLNYLNGLYQAAQGRIGTQSGLVQNERNYQDQALQYLLNLYQSATGQANQAAQINQANNAQKANAIGGIIGTAASIIPAFL